ncbi:hypothetical protein LIZ76_08975 [Caldibacillus sp. 210928-DFI.2.22]|uniref:hypothetical protein n=1 Tax=unclassified Caldibacillus TaxID=2641266 RepID=UPI001D07652A|nr:MULTISPECIES: hypothetical protein [unclassified Caldibacillus]MCB7070103.1 hypothetical protein [Caldibacillus sp. 210928-DFI.2.22]MCB7072620.1 hypothetical protein [Caldibacillus sp. 210928-DFI.2.18]
MRLTNNEKGYSLLLTMFVFILFTVLAMALLTATLTGSKRNQTSEHNIQAQELAMMGIDHLTNQINMDLKKELGENGLTQDQFKSILETTLNKYKSGVAINTGETGSYEAKITNIDSVKDNPLKKRATIVSTGIADGRKKSTTTKVVFGAQSTLDTLKYTVGAYKSDELSKKCNTNSKYCVRGEGNLFLHGGVSIKGDFKVDGNIITTDRGYAYLGGQQWIPSVLPTASPVEGQKASHIVLKGNVYTFDHNPDYDKHIETTNFNQGSTDKYWVCTGPWFWPKCKYVEKTTDSKYVNTTGDLSKAFFGTLPVITQREPIRDDIQIENQKNVFYFPEGPSVIYAQTLDGGYKKSFNQDLSYQNKKVYPQYCEKNNCKNPSTNEDFEFTGNNYFGNFATKRSLYIRGSKSNFKETKFENGAYIGGNLIIGNTDISEYSEREYPNNFEKIKLDGPIFVEGNVTIEGVNGQFNTIMYVKGDVTIEYSVINGLNNTGSLIIFAGGDIKIRNNSLYQDNPSNIKGFFYSEKALEMFGVGSNIKIEGGVSARRIVLNAIRGKASKTSFSGSKKVDDDYYEGQASQLNLPPEKSRLQIIYDPNIMNTYADLKSREPMVISVDPPQITERKLE